ncbi:MAG: cyclic nucleotide-binding domain-containing protein [Bdellovibrionaceae bacterium]|nr:cyclic nucleotide-binding domain-containing protein [Bdellovibrionales bacterium]MCB9086092.1 cyclic nucleotide-binding domain-containing protein [Pseudobdellovibrionaceae bacterium]
MILEQTSPELVSGKLIADGQRLAFESDSGLEQVVLPNRFRDIIELIDGKRTVRQIVSDLYAKTRRARFKDVFECLDRLAKAGVIKNLDSLNLRNPGKDNVYEQKLPGISKVFWQIPLGGIFTLSKTYPIVFNLAAVVILFLGLHSLVVSSNVTYLNVFLKIKESYVLGLVYFFLCNSILISLKSVLQFFMLILATGRVYGLRLQVNFFSVSLRVDSSSIYTTKARWFGLLFCLASISSYFFWVFVYSKLFANKMMLDQLYVMATLLTLVDLDPFSKSDASRIFNIFFEEENMNHLLPYLRKKALLAVTHRSSNAKREFFLILYSTLAIVWLFFCFSLSLNVFDQLLPNLASAIVNSSGPEKVASLVIVLCFVLVNLYLLTDILRLIGTTIYQPLFKVLRTDEGGSFGRKFEVGSKEGIASELRKIALFESLDETYLNKLVEHGKVLRYKRNSKIIVQGLEGKSMYVLLSGSVEVVKNHESGAEEHVAQLGPGSVFGEMALLTGALRNADVLACDGATVFEIQKRDFAQLLREDGHARLLEKIELNQYVSSSELFRGLPAETMHLFTREGEILRFESGKTLFSQGDVTDGFYLLLRGRVSVRIDGGEVAQIEQGGFFGEMALIMNAPRNATVVASEPIVALRISESLFWKVLSENLNLALFIESVAELRFEEDKMRSA